MHWWLRRVEAGLDLMPRHGAIAGIMIRARVAHATKHRTADLHRHVAKFFFDAISTVVARAALDRIDLRLWHQHQHVARLHAEILHPQVTGHVITDLAELVRELGP